MSKQVIWELSGLAVLVTYLCVSIWLRTRDARRQRREAWARAQEFRRQWQPTALDGSALSRQVEQVRRDYAAAAHSRPRPSGPHIRLIRSVRNAVLRMAYFQDVKDEPPDSSKHETKDQARQARRQGGVGQ